MGKTDFRGIVIGILVIIAGLIGLIYVVVDSLKDKPGALAIVIFFILMPTIAWAIFGAFQTARRAPDQHNRQPEAIEADYKVLQPTAPRAQLQSPRFIDVPTYHTNGQAQPLAAEIVLRSQGTDGQSLEVPYRYLLRFASCSTPARSEWVGKPQQFYQCQAWFGAHGFLQPQGQTQIWKPEYPLTSRLEWLQQFEPVTPVTGNR